MLNEKAIQNATFFDAFDSMTNKHLFQIIVYKNNDDLDAPCGKKDIDVGFHPRSANILKWSIDQSNKDYAIEFIDKFEKIHYWLKHIYYPKFGTNMTVKEFFQAVRDHISEDMFLFSRSCDNIKAYQRKYLGDVYKEIDR